MDLERILAITNASVINLSNDDLSLEYAFASDLMSDALALVRSNCEKTIFITGLCNTQSLRTADMLDMRTILYVRNKQINENDLDLAQELGMNILKTQLTMYEACGLLFKEGLLPVLKE